MRKSIPSEIKIVKSVRELEFGIHFGQHAVSISVAQKVFGAGRGAAEAPERAGGMKQQSEENV